MQTSFVLDSCFSRLSGMRQNVKFLVNLMSVRRTADTLREFGFSTWHSVHGSPVTVYLGKNP